MLLLKLGPILRTGKLLCFTSSVMSIVNVAARDFFSRSRKPILIKYLVLKGRIFHAWKKTQNATIWVSGHKTLIFLKIAAASFLTAAKQIVIFN